VGDEALARDLWALLDADRETGEKDPLSGIVASEAAALQSRELDGTRLGNWLVVEPIGEGGMGTVYLAERADGAYDTQAALKLVRGGIPSPMLDERFRTERQILAGLSHPGVAQLLDGGSTPDGTPYLVMEYIDGAPITQWCEQQQLDVEARLRLFVKVCDAVAYAHGQLVAHRDLKPSNILVTKDGEPKLLDFGIAKLMDSLSEGEEGATQSYAIMTPAYSSPEQVSGERASASADTYSLGVLL
jgi:serine/threonine protein kinase